MLTETREDREHGPHWLVIGDEGAVSFFIYDGHQSPIGIHRMYGDGEASECEYLPGGYCYPDVTFTHGKELFDYWEMSGRKDVTIFNELREWYRSHIC